MNYKGICLFLIVGSVLMASGCTGGGQQSSTTNLPGNTNTQTSAVTSYLVSFTIERGSSGDIVVTNVGGAGANSLKKVEISFVNNAGATVGPDTCSNLTANGVSGSLDTVGSSATIAKSNTAVSSHVIVIGTFKDDTQQVLTVGDV